MQLCIDAFTHLLTQLDDAHRHPTG
jgi:hypothetical protein